MSGTDITSALTKYATLKDWLIKSKRYIGPDDVREMTHTALDGGKYNVDRQQYPIFLELLIRDLNRINPFTYYLCEFLTEHFIMFGDFDIESKDPFTEKDWDDIAKVTQETMRNCYPDNKELDVSAAWFQTAPDMKKNSNGELIYRYGLHPVWYGIVVNRKIALEIHVYLLASIKRFLPNPEPPSNSWEARLDKGVYGGESKPGSLRLPGCEKMTICKLCKSARKKNPNVECEKCENGKLQVGRPYRPTCIRDENGKQNIEETSKFAGDWRQGLKLGHLRCERSVPCTPGFRLPINAPKIFDPSSYDMEDDLKEIKTDVNAINANEVKKSKNQNKQRKLTAKMMYLENYLTFPNNRTSFNKLKMKYKYRVEHKALKKMIQNSIREYNSNYSDLNVLDIRTDKKASRPSTWLIHVDGIGSHHCLNKGDIHNTSSIYFMISPDGKLYQKCNSIKPIERPVGHALCSNYESSHQTLPNVIIEALTFKPDENRFGSVEEQLGYKKYEINHRRKQKEMSEQLYSEALSEGIHSQNNDVRALSKLIVKNNKPNNLHKNRLDENYLYSLYLLNFACRYKIPQEKGGFSTQDISIDDSDVRNLTITEIQVPKRGKESMSFAEQMNNKYTTKKELVSSTKGRKRK